MSNDNFDLGFDSDPLGSAISDFVQAAQDIDAVMQKSRQKVAADLADIGNRLGDFARKGENAIKAEIAETTADTLPILALMPEDQLTSSPPPTYQWCVMSLTGDNGWKECLLVRSDEVATGQYDAYVNEGCFDTFDEAARFKDNICSVGDPGGEDPDSPQEPEPPSPPPEPPQPPEPPGDCPTCCQSPCCCDKPPEPPTGLRYCVWFSEIDQRCIILPEGSEDRTGNYRQGPCFDSFDAASAYAAENCADWPETPPEPPQPPEGVWYCLWKSDALRACSVTTAPDPQQCRSPGAGWVLIGTTQSSAELAILKTLYCVWPDTPQDPEDPEPPQPPQPPEPPQPPQPPEPPTDPEVGDQSDFSRSRNLCDGDNWKRLDDAGNTVGNIADAGAVSLRQKQLEEKFTATITDLINSVFPTIPSILIKGFVSRFVDNATKILRDHLRLGPVPGDCIDLEYLQLLGINFVVAMVTKWIGNIPKKAEAQLTYSENFKCPWLLPTVAEADNAYLTGEFDDETLETLHRLNGACFDSSYPVTRSKRAKLSPISVVQLLRRGEIDSEAAAAEIRANGYLAKDSLSTFITLEQFLPGPSDIIRFMQRDVDDAATVAAFGLDDEFTAKFAGRTKELAEWQGVDEQDMLRYWRAHWDIPSPTQLYEFYRRLRDPAETPVPKAALDLGVESSPSWGPRTNKANLITEADVKKALAQQDILPFWQDRFLATSYLPLTRVDARRAFELGVITISQVYESLIQNGYSPENAATLTAFAARDKDLKIPSQEAYRFYRDGLISYDNAITELVGQGYREAVVVEYLTKLDRQRMVAARSLDTFRLYVDGEATESDLRNDLFTRFYRADQIEQLIERANTELDKRLRNRCIAGYREQFLRGEFTKDEAKQKLRDMGLNEPWIQRTVEGWACEFEATDRLPRVRMVAEWLMMGIVNEKEADEILQRMRYDDETRNRILAQITIIAQQRRDKEAEKLQRKEEREVERRRVARERSRKARERELERQARLRLKRKGDAEKLAIALQKLAEKWADYLDLDLKEASDAVQQEYGFVLDEFGLEDKYSLAVVTRAVEYAIKEKETDLRTLVELIGPEVQQTADALI